ncbi:RsiV family protein [Lysinibacillus sp. NPDC059133]|uniref:RsiV family protein n=1 Tax=Lysinibacillus sp. NPDC059133 TaxID=3346737 RepID=UPI0036A79855
MDEKLKELEKQYNEIPIPKELDFVVENALKQGKKKKKNRAPQWLLGSAAAAMLLTAGLNVSPAMARTLSEIPVVGSVVTVLTWTEYEVAEDTYDANIKVPSIENLENKELSNALNEKYRSEGKALFDKFIPDVGVIKTNGGGVLGVDSGYEVKTDNDQILSIGRYTTTTIASSSTVMHYDTIDKKNEILITLPMLFKDDNYIKTISENIKDQMREQMAIPNSRKVYWVKDAGLSDEEFMDNDFSSINADQQFYISDKGKLVISFDEYEIAPGYMGVVEFEIPTDVIKNDLVSTKYVH